MRVCIEIMMGDVKHRLLVLKADADTFIEDWYGKSYEEKLSISGILDDRDGNEVSVFINRESITGVVIIEIRGK